MNRNVVRGLIACVAFAGGIVGTASSDDALPGGAILRLGSTKYRQSERWTPSTLTPDGRSILQYQSPNILRYFSVETGKQTHTVKLKEKLSQYAYMFRIMPDGQRLIIFCDNRMRVVNPHSGETLWTYLAVGNRNLVKDTYETDGKAERFAYALEEQQNNRETSKVRVRDTRNGDKIVEFDVLQTSSVRSILSSDGKRLATCGHQDSRKEKVEDSAGVVQIWDVDEKKEIARIKTTSSQITSVRFSVDGKGCNRVSGVG